MYMDSKKHTGSTGAPAKLSRKVRGAWQAHVSVLIITFEKAPGGTVVEIVHVGVPQDDQKGAPDPSIAGRVLESGRREELE
jgi:hypothetical protein